MSPRQATAETLPILQRTPEWIEAREHGVGASEAGAALGLSQYESRLSLWARKLGLVPPPEPSLAMLVGLATEPLNAQRYTEATGLRVRRVNRLKRRRDRPYLLASLDRQASDGRLVELKWSERAAGYGDPGTDEVPYVVLAQVVQQMAVTGVPIVDVSLLVGGRDHRIYTIRRDADAEQAVMDGVGDFWHAVEERLEPDIDGSESTRRTLAERYPRHDGEIRPADDDERALLEQWRSIDRNARQVDDAEGLVKARIIAAIAESKGLEAEGLGKVQWVTGRTVAWKRVASALVESLGIDGPARFAEIVSANTTASPKLVPSWTEEVIDA